MNEDVRVGVLLGSAASTVVLATILLDADASGNMFDGSISMWLQLGATGASLSVAAVMARSRAGVQAVARQYTGTVLGAAAGLFLLAPVAIWFGAFILLFAATGLVWAAIGMGIGHGIGALLPRRSGSFPALPHRWRRWPLAAVAACVLGFAIWQGPGALLASPLAFLAAWTWGTTQPARPALVGATIGALAALGLVAGLLRSGVTVDTQRGGLDAMIAVAALALATALCAWLTARVCRAASGRTPEQGLQPGSTGAAGA